MGNRLELMPFIPGSCLLIPEAFELPPQATCRNAESLSLHAVAIRLIAAMLSSIYSVTAILRIGDAGSGMPQVFHFLWNFMDVNDV